MRSVAHYFRLTLICVRDIIETLRMMVAEKNSDELFQNAVFASYAGDASRAKQGGVVPVSKDDVKSDANQGDSLRVLCAAGPDILQPLRIFVSS